MACYEYEITRELVRVSSYLVYLVYPTYGTLL